MLTSEEIFGSLCNRDPINPIFDDIYGHQDEPAPAPRTDCSCDNCFYGRDPLAVALIEASPALRLGVEVQRRSLLGRARFALAKQTKNDNDKQPEDRDQQEDGGRGLAGSAQDHAQEQGEGSEHHSPQAQDDGFVKE